MDNIRKQNFVIEIGSNGIADVDVELLKVNDCISTESGILNREHEEIVSIQGLVTWYGEDGEDYIIDYKDSDKTVKYKIISEIYDSL